MRKILFFTYIIFIITACGDNKLGDGYAFGECPEYGTTIILAKSDTVLDPKYYKYYNKGTFIKKHLGNKIDTFFLAEGGAVIFAHVVNACFDSTFILVDQKPLDSIWGPYQLIDDRCIRPNEPLNLNKAIKKIKTSKIHMYWIIKHKTNDRYGPFKWDEYLKKKKELGVPKKLKLK